MNIIEHLSQVVTPKVLKRNATAKESLLLRDFYALFLARILEKKAYDILTDEGKQSPSRAKLVKLDWVDANADIISQNLAQNYSLDEAKVHTMLSRATPLALKEVTNLSDGMFVPDYLQEMLENPEDAQQKTFVEYIPSWALAHLPAGLLSEGILPAHLLGSVVGESNIGKSLPEPVHADARKFDHEATISGSASVSKERLVKDPANGGLKRNNRSVLSADSKTTSVSSSKPSSYAQSLSANSKKPVNSLNDSQNSTSSKSSGLKKALPLAGLVIFGVLVWSMVRGCVNDDQQNTFIADNSKDIPTAEIQNFEPSKFTMTLDASGEKFISATGSVGSAKQVDDINKSIKRVYGATAVSTTKYTIDETVKSTMPAMENLSDLLTLIKGAPNASMEVSDTVIVFVTDNKTDGKKLIKKANKILPDFKISAEKRAKNPQIEATAKAEAIAKVKEAARAKAEVKKKSEEKATDLFNPNIEKNEAKENNKNKKWNANNAVSSSIQSADEALNKLSRQETITAKELTDALNLQVIDFSVSKADIPLANQKILSKASVLLQKIPDARLRLIVHTDTDGNEDYNQRLSDDRALSVKRYIMSKGFKSSRIKAIGKGESQPIAKNDTKQGKFNNRRIEFKVTQVGKK